MATMFDEHRNSHAVYGYAFDAIGQDLHQLLLRSQSSRPKQQAPLGYHNARNFCLDGGVERMEKEMPIRRKSPACWSLFTRNVILKFSALLNNIRDAESRRLSFPGHHPSLRSPFSSSLIIFARQVRFYQPQMRYIVRTLFHERR